MNAIIITIGDEILMGQILDTNAQYIARRFMEIGVEVVEEVSIPDKREEQMRRWIMLCRRRI
ncbi:MAG: molybdopterin-binding protein [Odoribacter sp.]